MAMESFAAKMAVAGKQQSSSRGENVYIGPAPCQEDPAAGAAKNPLALAVPVICGIRRGAP